ncbi:N-acylethanolamine-hydrolyzing acid amidase (Acylsphingosine deacylase NAAA) (N-acylsphingosine amidohydrolase-like) (ASAH-like protein) [Cleaved into: N-acylethanolamine-hydrolyzing acid amidase subunit alpha [Durusdinium trenchii]|uniref:Uncharacterized protein n=1 Tax=Durusdinium trenchii TaxID=1381693 RepID=A0ABP0J460_9DINO
MTRPAFIDIEAFAPPWCAPQQQALRQATERSRSVGHAPRRLTVNLDLAPQERRGELGTYSDRFESPRDVWGFGEASWILWAEEKEEKGFESYHTLATGYLEKYIPGKILPLVDHITKHMDAWNSLTQAGRFAGESAYYHDYAEEMQSLASALNLSLGEVVAGREAEMRSPFLAVSSRGWIGVLGADPETVISKGPVPVATVKVLLNLVYQVEQIGTACYKVNTTGPCPSGPGLCSALVAESADAVWQGRNLDWDLDKSLLPFVVEVDYISQNQTRFRGVQVLGMIGVLHGMAPERFSVQINARDRGGSAVANLLEELLLGGKTPTHVIRKALETPNDYSAARRFLEDERLANPVYFILSGAQMGEGAIVTRDRQHSTTWALHEDNPKDSKHLNECPGSRDLAKSIGITKAVGEAFMNQAVPRYDDRRGPGVRFSEGLQGSHGVNETSVMSVMTRWPVKNHHTDITSVMCAKKNQMKTLVWDPIHDVPVGLVI